MFAQEATNMSILMLDKPVKRGENSGESMLFVQERGGHMQTYPPLVPVFSLPLEFW